MVRQTSMKVIRPPRKPLPARSQELRAIVDASDPALALARMVKDGVLYGSWAAKMSESSRDSTPDIVESEVFYSFPRYIPQTIPLYVVDFERLNTIYREYWSVVSDPSESVEDFDSSG